MRVRGGSLRLQALRHEETAAGLLIDSGLTEREAMHFSGHATPSMFDPLHREVTRSTPENVKEARRLPRERLAEKPALDAERLAFFPKVSGE
jgi:hypothetical protein